MRQPKSTRAVRLVGVVRGLFVCAAPAAGQEILAGGMALAGALPAVEVRVRVKDDNECRVNRLVVEAEAERALRRDEIAVTDDPETAASVLRVSVAVLDSKLIGSDRVIGCASTVNTLLVVPVQRVVVVAAVNDVLQVASRGNHVDWIRSEIEETVSVIANALRRERDNWLGVNRDSR